MIKVFKSLVFVITAAIIALSPCSVANANQGVISSNTGYTFQFGRDIFAHYDGGGCDSQATWWAQNNFPDNILFYSDSGCNNNITIMPNEYITLSFVTSVPFHSLELSWGQLRITNYNVSYLGSQVIGAYTEPANVFLNTVTARNVDNVTRWVAITSFHNDIFAGQFDGSRDVYAFWKSAGTFWAKDDAAAAAINDAHNDDVRRREQEKQEQQQQQQQALQQSSNQSDSSKEQATSSGSTLLQLFTGFVSAVSDASPSSCSLPLNFGHFAVSDVDLCTLPVPSYVQVIGSLVVIALFVPFAVAMFRRFISLFRSFQG